MSLLSASAGYKIFLCYDICQTPDMPHVLVSNVETVPDLAGFAARMVTTAKPRTKFAPTRG